MMKYIKLTSVLIMLIVLSITTISVSADSMPPVVSDPQASHEIPDDTDGILMWGETATLSVRVTDPDGIATVTVDLSELGGGTAVVMTNTCSGDVYTAGTGAIAGTPPGVYNVRVTAIDTPGNINPHTLIPVQVVMNGDVTGNGKRDIGDALRLTNNISYPGNPLYVLSSIYAADVTGNGLINIGDALRLTNNISYPGNQLYILK